MHWSHVSAALLVLVFAQYSLAAKALSNDRIESILKGVKGGVIVKDGKRTSCEIAVTSAISAFTSVDCLDIHGDFTWNSTTLHELYLDAGANGRPEKHNISLFTILDSYRPDNFVQNFAAVRYDTPFSAEWTQKVAPVVDFDWDAVVYTRRRLLDIENMIWAPIEFTVGSISYDDACLSMSAQFKANASMFLCSDLTVPSYSNDLSKCDIPYGIVYGILNDDAYLLGLYSYTAIKYGTDLCQNAKQRSYYSTVYRDVNSKPSEFGIPYDRTPELFTSNASSLNTDSTLNATTAATDESDIIYIRSDLFANQSRTVVFASELWAAAETDYSSNSEDLGDLDSEANKSSTGLSKKTNIIIGVCASIGVLIIICSVFFGAVWWRRHRRSGANSARRSLIENTLESEFGGLTIPRDALGSQIIAADYDLPPVYNSLAGNYLAAQTHQPSHNGRTELQHENDKK